MSKANSKQGDPGIVVGIDLGTTFSALARINEFHKPELLKNREGKSLTPSVVAVCVDPPVVGDEAKQLQAVGEEGVASFFKRAMGDPNWQFDAAGRLYTPTDLSALVLGKLKADAETVLNASVTDAVITVPAYFNNDQREATKAAGEAAGLNVLLIINEPTAAALAFGLGGGKIQGKVMVYDLGGGTFDVTVIELDEEEIRVLATDGDHELGGKNWDDRLAEFIAGEFYDEHGEQPLDDRESADDVVVAAEQAKIALSSAMSTKMRITHAGIRAAYTISREQFGGLTGDLLERTSILAENVLRNLSLGWSDLSGVLLVGGSTRMPMVGEFVQSRFGSPAVAGVNVDEAVALGAAIQANQLAGQQSGRAVYSLPGAKRFQDVTSHSLGMVAVSEDGSAYVNSIILAKNQPIPSEDTRPYKLQTTASGPNTLEVYITQGESTVPMQCAFIGRYTADNVPHGKEGQSVVDITYAYDHSGIVQVAAEDRKTKEKLAMIKGPVPDDMSWVELPPSATGGQGHVTAYLAVDLSGSMSGKPLREAQDAAREFARQTDMAHSSVGLITFADKVRTNIEATQDVKALEKAISKMSIGAVGYGNLASPFEDTRRLLQDVTGARYIIVLTDGVWSRQDVAINQAKKCHADEIEVIAIGFGQADRKFLAAVATSEAASFFTRSGELVKTFGGIAQQITEGGGQLRKL